MRGIYLRIEFAKERHFAAKDRKIEKLGFEGIVEVCGVVCNFIDPVNQLSFERWALIKKIFRKLGKLRRGVIPRMLDDAFANFKRKIQSGKIEVAMLELLDDAERMQVVIEEAAMRVHEFVELAFASVAEWRVTDVVDEGEGFGKLGVQVKRGSDGSGDLRDFERMRQPIAKMVGVARGEDLCFGFEAAEGAGMDDAVAVARVVTAIGMRGLRKAPAARLLGVHCPGSKSGNSIDGPLHCFQLICANGKLRSGSGLRRNLVQTAIGLVRHGGIRKFLFDLLVDGSGFLRIGLAQETCQFQEHQRPGHEHGGLVS